MLIAPLDWGLGHATRCIPIIKELISQGVKVTIAATIGQKALLNQEFAHLEFLEIPGYQISYKRGILLKWALFFNIPRLLRQIKKENNWLEDALRNRKIDAVISDNRYGLFHKEYYCVFITHQLYIQSGRGSFGRVSGWRLAVGRLIDRKILKWNYGFIEKFSACWVPDLEGDFSIAGLLSHPPTLPMVPVKYIGILSRFYHSERKIEKDSLLILLSGPEPQRTEFENILVIQLSDLPMKTVVVRGLPSGDHPIPFAQEGVKIFNHLRSDELNKLMNETEFIIARSGYSTIMDLLTMKKNAILVPTPGQTEQEYLGYFLHEKHWMHCVPQKNFNLQKTIVAFQNRKMLLPVIPDTMLRTVVEEFVKTLLEKQITKAQP